MGLKLPRGKSLIRVLRFIDQGSLGTSQRVVALRRGARSARHVDQHPAAVGPGHPRAELGLVLRAIDALNIQLDASVDQGNQVRHRRTNPVDIDAIISKARKTKS